MEEAHNFTKLALEKVATGFELVKLPELRRGLENLNASPRGASIPFAGLRTRFGMEARPFGKRTRIVSIEMHGIIIGLMTDSPGKVFKVTQDVVEPSPATAASADLDCVSGAEAPSDRLLTWTSSVPPALCASRPRSSGKRKRFGYPEKTSPAIFEPGEAFAVPSSKDNAEKQIRLPALRSFRTGPERLAAFLRGVVVNHGLIAAVLLGRVKRLVRRIHEIFQETALPGFMAEGHAHADGDMQTVLHYVAFGIADDEVEPVDGVADIIAVFGRFFAPGPETASPNSLPP